MNTTLLSHSKHCTRCLLPSSAAYDSIDVWRCCILGCYNIEEIFCAIRRDSKFCCPKRSWTVGRFGPSKNISAWEISASIGYCRKKSSAVRLFMAGKNDCWRKVGMFCKFCRWFSHLAYLWLWSWASGHCQRGYSCRLALMIEDWQWTPHGLPS